LSGKKSKWNEEEQQPEVDPIRKVNPLDYALGDGESLVKFGRIQHKLRKVVPENHQVHAAKN
jgi:hypothetical protein